MKTMTLSQYQEAAPAAELELFNHDASWLSRVDNIVIELHGEECRQTFLNAFRHRGFLISNCGELTCCAGTTARL
jgi:hypothetical protein